MFKVNKTKYIEVNNATFVKSVLDLEKAFSYRKDSMEI